VASFKELITLNFGKVHEAIGFGALLALCDKQESFATAFGIGLPWFISTRTLSTPGRA
jgi:hypothetical protein